jgi:hypothetical protein
MRGERTNEKNERGGKRERRGVMSSANTNRDQTDEENCF